jgi:hypothetical protein
MNSRLSFINMGEREFYRDVKQLIDALSEDNIDGIKNLLCKEVLNSPETDEQIKNAMSFFKGQVVSYTKNGLFNVRESSGSFSGISSAISDIETTEGKIYQVYFADYLTYRGHKDWVGIDLIIVRDMTGVDTKAKGYSPENVPHCDIGYSIGDYFK